MNSTQKHSVNHNQMPKREVDPRFLHLEGFRRTLNDVRRAEQMGTHAASSSIEGHVRHNPRRSLAKAAHEYAGQLDPKDPRKIYSSLLAEIPSYAEAISRLPRDDEPSSLTFDERQAEVMKTIDFNNVVKDIINHHPRLDPAILESIVKASVNQYQYSPAESTDIIDRVNSSIRGMQHELAFESALYYLPEEFEVLETTKDDDAVGVDYRVKCPNGVIVSIDVKATDALADKAYQKRVKRYAKRGKTPPMNEMILATNFQKTDFRPDYPWRAKDEAIETLVPFVEESLMIGAGMIAPTAEQAIAK